VQQYVEASSPTVTRMEFIGGEFFYAVRVDTSQGFELCPSDACAPDAAVCDVPARPRFEVIEGFDHWLIERCKTFLAAYDAKISGIEFIEDREGRPFVYDVNFNTNYNPEAEAAAGKYGMKEIARYLTGLAGLQPPQRVQSIRDVLVGVERAIDVHDLVVRRDHV